MRFSRPSFGAAILAFAAVAVALPLHGQRAGPISIGTLKIPAPTGYVNDFAGVLDPQSEAAIQAVVDDVRAKSGGAEIVVVTLPSLEGRPVDDVAIAIGRGWGIGSRGAVGDSLRNVGTLLLVAPRERRVRIEVSEGANNFLTAPETGRIRDQYMIPAFREGDYARGIRLGVQALAQAHADRYGFALSPASAAPPPPVRAPPVQQPRGSRGGGFSPGLIIFLVVIAFFFLRNRGGGGGPGGRRRRGYGGPIIIPFPMGGGGWGGGGFGGGDGGGGFGGFGGGGGWSGGGSEGSW